MAIPELYPLRLMSLFGSEIYLLLSWLSTITVEYALSYSVILLLQASSEYEVLLIQ